MLSASASPPYYSSGDTKAKLYSIIVNCYQYQIKKYQYFPRVGVSLLGILCEGVPPVSPNHDPISDQTMSFSTPIFRPEIS